MIQDTPDFMKRWPVNVKNNQYFVLLVLLFFVSSLRASENELKFVVEKSISLNNIINTTLSAPKRNFCSMPQAIAPICPEVLLEEALDNDKSGIVGNLNLIDSTLTGSDNFSTPNHICKNAKLNKSEFNDSNLNCPGISLRARDYLNSFLVEKKSIVESNMISLLSVKSQIDLLIGKKENVNCEAFDIPATQATCRNLNSCGSGNKTLFEQKLDNVFDTVELVRRLKKEARSGPFKKELNQAIDALLEANPILKSRAFEPLFWNTNRPLERDQVSKAYRKELDRTRSNAITNLGKNHKAYLCMLDKSLDCKDFSETVRTQFGASGQLSGKVSDSYRCLENAKESRNEANKVLNDVAISAALTFTPMAALSLSKLLYQGGKLVKTAAMLENVKKKTMMAAMAADGIYAGNEIQKVNKSCEEKIIQLQRPVNDVSCNHQTDQIKLQTDVANCSSQVLTAGLSSLSPALGIFSLSFAKLGAPRLTALLKAETDEELTALLNKMVNKIPDKSARSSKLKDLETKVVSLLKFSKGYSEEEIKNGLKVLMKRCLDH